MAQHIARGIESASDLKHAFALCHLYRTRTSRSSLTTIPDSGAPYVTLEDLKFIQWACALAVQHALAYGCTFKILLLIRQVDFLAFG